MIFTAMIPYMTKGVKYTIVGDSKGKVHIWLSNGTFKGSMKVDETKITKLKRFYPNVLYATEHNLGFLRPNALMLSTVTCQSTKERIIDVEIELASN